MIVRTFFLPVCLLLSIGLLIGCVDVNDSNLPTGKDFRATIRFVDVATDAPASGALVADGATLGRLSFGQSTAYLDVAAGSRTLVFAGTSQVVTFATNQQGTVLVAPLNDVNRFLLLNEGNDFKNNGQADTVLVRFVNVAQGSAKTLTFAEGGPTGDALSSSVTYFSPPAYTQVSRGSHRVYVVSSGGYQTSLSNVVSGTGTFTLTASDGLAYTFTIVSANRATADSTFFIVAGFGPGNGGGPPPHGTVISHAMDVSGQVVSFPADSLTGASTSAVGVGTFSLSANAGRDSFALAYSLTVTGDSADPFTAAHFNRAGGVVRTIHPITGDQFVDTAITGTWATGDAESLTKGLVDSLLAGRLSVVFQSAAHTGGLISARLAPDATTSNTFSGVWTGTTLTDAAKQAVVLGTMYVEFDHVTGRSVVGQITVDSTKGHYGVASLSGADTMFVAGKMYTIVATGSGTNLSLIKLTDRQVGSAKLTAHKPSK